MASASLDFHFSATSFASGSSGLGALSNAWIDSSTVRICRAGDHLSEERKKDRVLRKIKKKTNKKQRDDRVKKVEKREKGSEKGIEVMVYLF